MLVIVDELVWVGIDVVKIYNLYCVKNIFLEE